MIHALGQQKKTDLLAHGRAAALLYSLPRHSIAVGTVQACSSSQEGVRVSVFWGQECI